MYNYRTYDIIQHLNPNLYLLLAHLQTDKVFIIYFHIYFPHIPQNTEEDKFGIDKYRFRISNILKYISHILYQILYKNIYIKSTK